MPFLYEYMTESEKQEVIFETQMNRDSIALDNQWNRIVQEHALRLEDINLSVMLERYSDDDMTAMYERELAVYMEGVKEWWATFKKWVKDLVTKLTGKPTDEQQAAINEAKKSNDEVELPCNVDETLKGAKKVLSMIEGRFKYKKDDGTYDKEKIAKDAVNSALVAAAFGGTGIAVKEIFKHTKYKKSQLPEFIEPVNKTLDEANKVVQSFHDDEVEGSWWKSVITKIIDALKKAKDAILGFITKGVNAVKNIGKKNETITDSDDQKAIEGSDRKALPATDNSDKSDDIKDDKKDADVSDLNKKKQSIKTKIVKYAKNWGFFDKSKGDKLTVDDLLEYVAKMKAHDKKGKHTGEIKQFETLLNDCKDAGIMEFTLDDLKNNELPVMESMTPIDDVIIERELLLMTESEEEIVNELADLADLL